MNAQARQMVYAIAAVVGLCVTWYFNLQHMQLHGGFDLVRFVSDCYVNAAAASISNDLLVIVFAFLFWSFFEARKLGMKHWWAYFVLTFSIAIAFAGPLFLFMRERRLAAMGD